MRRKKEKSWPPSLPPFPGAVEAQSGKGREGPFLPSPPLPCTGVGINHCDRARASTYNTSFQIRNARGFGSLAMEKGERGILHFSLSPFSSRRILLVLRRRPRAPLPPPGPPGPLTRSVLPRRAPETWSLARRSRPSPPPSAGASSAASRGAGPRRRRRRRRAGHWSRRGSGSRWTWL